MSCSSNVIENAINRIVEERNDIVSIILFGSHARNDWTIESDFDILIILHKCTRRIIDRPLDFVHYFSVPVDIFVYDIYEVLKMYLDGNVLILDCLKYGKVLYDKGFWKFLKQIFEREVIKGTLVETEIGWYIRR